MLGEKIKEHEVKVWLINTGWSGGAYGVGTRISLHYTRAIIAAALEGKLENEVYRPLPFFGLMMPTSCPGVPGALLNPEVTWEDKEHYLQEAHKLAEIFAANFTKYTALVSPEIISAGPAILTKK
jgi:phosphoenolpyruvate carboxykinase (ATP)